MRFHYTTMCMLIFCMSVISCAISNAENFSSPDNGASNITSFELASTPEACEDLSLAYAGTTNEPIDSVDENIDNEPVDRIDNDETESTDAGKENSDDEKVKEPVEKVEEDPEPPAASEKPAPEIDSAATQEEEPPSNDTADADSNDEQEEESSTDNPPAEVTEESIETITPEKPEPIEVPEPIEKQEKVKPDHKGYWAEEVKKQDGQKIEKQEQEENSHETSIQPPPPGTDSKKEPVSPVSKEKFDIVVIPTPTVPESYNLISPEQLQEMKEEVKEPVRGAKDIARTEEPVQSVKTGVQAETEEPVFSAPVPEPVQTVTKDTVLVEPIEKVEDMKLTIAEVPEQEEKKKKDKPKVDLSGFRYLKYRSYSATGSEGTYLTRGGLYNDTNSIEQGTNLKVSAQINEKTKISGSFDEMPKQDRKMVFNLDYGHYKGTFGTFSAKIEGGQLSPFSKSIDGVQVVFDNGVTKAMFMSSKSKSQTKTITFTGRNLKGPYDLNARDLVPESITVQLNDQVLSQDDYVLDAFIGEITFFEILGPDDVVRITYERRLTGSLNEGSLSGFSFDHKLLDDKMEIGFSQLTKEANRASETVVENVTSETPAIDPNNRRRIYVGGSLSSILLLVRRDYRSGSETITYQGTELEPNKDYNVIATVGASNILENFAYGVFELKDPVATGTESQFKVSYSYYNETYVNCYSDADERELVLDQSGAPFGYLESGIPGTIYYGSEQIYWCTDEDLVGCDTTPLVREVDYYVEEELNRVRFYDASIVASAGSMKIVACTYPDADLADTAYDQQVTDYRVSYEVNDNLNFKYEQAQSQADISTKPISVINQTVRNAAAADLNCSTLATPNACTFNLGNTNVVSDTLVVYFNDRISDDSVVPRSSYIIDPTQGSIEFTILIPAGTVILADYQYTPDNIGVAQGTLSYFESNFKSSKTRLSLKMSSGDTFFTPIGGSNNLETGRFNMNVSQKFSDRLSVTATMMDVDNALDLLETHTRTSKQRSYKIDYKPKYLTKFSFSTDSRTITDDYSPSKTDSSENKNAISFGFKVPFLNSADMSYTMTSTNQTDNTQANTGRDTNNRSMAFNYSPSKKLSLKMTLTTNAIESRSTDLTFTSTNRTQKIGAKWKPIDLLNVGIDLDSQLTSDSRPTSEDKQVSKTRVNISAAPTKRVKTASFTFSREDRPSVTGPSSGTKNTAYNLGFIITPAFTFSPRFSTTVSTVGDTSSTTTNAKNYLLEFRPPGDPYFVTLGMDNTETDSVRTGSASSQNNESLTLTIGYDPSPMWNYSMKYKSESSSSTSGSNYDTGTLNLKATRKLKSGNTMWLMYDSVTRSGTISETDAKTEFGTEMKISDILSFNFMYKYSTYSNAADSDRNFQAHLLETMLRADF